MKPYHNLLICIAIVLSACTAIPDSNQTTITPGATSTPWSLPLQVIPPLKDESGNALPLYGYSNGMDLISSVSPYIRPEPVAAPIFKNHPRLIGTGLPSESLNDVLTKNGCTRVGLSTRYECPFYSYPYQIGCRKVDPIQGYWTLLYPESPLIGICITDLDGSTVAGMENQPFVVYSGCMFRVGIRYLAIDNDLLFLIKDVNMLRDIIAPIKSENEALFYAMAATSSGALYDLKQNKDLYYLTTEIEDSYVEATQTGYKVHTFHTAGCSCNPHVTEAFDIFVTTDGQLTIDQATPVFDDGTGPGYCVD